MWFRELVGKYLAAISLVHESFTYFIKLMQLTLNFNTSYLSESQKKRWEILTGLAHDHANSMSGRHKNFVLPGNSHLEGHNVIRKYFPEYVRAIFAGEWSYIQWGPNHMHRLKGLRSHRASGPPFMLKKPRTTSPALIQITRNPEIKEGDRFSWQIRIVNPPNKDVYSIANRTSSDNTLYLFENSKLNKYMFDLYFYQKRILIIAYYPDNPDVDFRGAYFLRGVRRDDILYRAKWHHWESGGNRPLPDSELREDRMWTLRGSFPQPRIEELLQEDLDDEGDDSFMD